MKEDDYVDAMQQLKFLIIANLQKIEIFSAIALKYERMGLKNCSLDVLNLNPYQKHLHLY